MNAIKQIIKQSDDWAKSVYERLDNVTPVEKETVDAIREIIFNVFKDNDIEIKATDKPIMIDDETKTIIELHTRKLCDVLDPSDIKKDVLESIDHAITDTIQLELKRYDNPTIVYIKEIKTCLVQETIDYKTGEIIKNPMKPRLQIGMRFGYNTKPLEN